MLINGREKVETEIFKKPKAFIDYSQTIDDVYENLEDYNPTKKRRVLLVFDYMIADIESNKKISNWMFLRRRKLNISLGFISQSYFKAPTSIMLNVTHYYYYYYFYVLFKTHLQRSKEKSLRLDRKFRQ